MKIGFVLDDTLDKPDGVQQYVISLAGWLRAQGHEVHFLCGQTKRRDLLHLHSLSRNVRVRFNHNRLSTPLPANKAKITALLNKEKYDILHVQMPYSPFLAGRVIRAAPPNTIIIGTFHILPFTFVERLATRALGLYLRRNAKRFYKVLAVSPPAAKFAKKIFGVRAAVIPNPVHVHHFASGKRLRKYDDGKVNIMFLGRLVERKGCRELLEAVQHLHKKGKLVNVRVVIGGSGPLKKSLEAYVHDHRLSTIVHFVGFVPEADKPDFLASAHLAVFPAMGGESFGIVLLEAMASGAEAVLAGRNAGYRSVIQKKEQLVNAHDTAAFAKTLKHYILSGPARRRARNWQQKAVTAYDVNVVGKQIIRLYNEALLSNKEMR